MEKMKDVKLAIILVFSFCLLLIYGCSGGYNEQTGIYEGYGIILTFPEGWKKSQDIPGAVFSAESPDKSAHISLVVRKVKEDTTIEEFLNVVSRQTVGVGAREEERGTIDMNGYDGLWVLRTINVGGDKFRSISYYVKNGNTIYAIVTTTEEDVFEKWEPTFDEVAKTITFSD